MVEIAEEKGFFQCSKCNAVTTLSRRNVRLGQRCSNCGTLMDRKFEKDVEPTTLIVEESKVIEDVKVEEKKEVRVEETEKGTEAVQEAQEETVEEVQQDRLEDSEGDKGTPDTDKETETVDEKVEVVEAKTEVKEEEKIPENVVSVQEPSKLVEDAEVPKTIAELEQVVKKDAKAVDIEAESDKLVKEAKKKAINTVGASDVKEIEKAIEEIKEEESG